MSEFIISTRLQTRREEERLDFEEDDAVDEWRRRIRETFMQRILEGGEEESSKYYETDSEEEEEEEKMGIAMVKPVYVPHTERNMIVEREKKIQAETRAIEDSIKGIVEELKVKTKGMVIEEIRKDMEIQIKNIEISDDVLETDDEMKNEAEEYEVLNAREIAGALKRN